MSSLLDQLRAEVEAEMDLMTAVATGGPNIDGVNRSYRERRQRIRRLLKQLGLTDPNPYDDLWMWYGKWSRDLGNYQLRREYIRELFAPLLEEVERLEDESLGSDLEGFELDELPSVANQVAQLHVRAATCDTAEDAQAVGLLCRDILISLADEMHDEVIHGEVGQSAVDRLNAVVGTYAEGSSNQKLRKLIKATIDFANVVQHRRDGSPEEAMIVAEATMAVVRLLSRLRTWWLKDVPF